MGGRTPVAVCASRRRLAWHTPPRPGTTPAPCAAGSSDAAAARSRSTGLAGRMPTGSCEGLCDVQRKGDGKGELGPTLCLVPDRELGDHVRYGGQIVA